MKARGVGEVYNGMNNNNGANVKEKIGVQSDKTKGTRERKREFSARKKGMAVENDVVDITD